MFIYPTGRKFQQLQAKFLLLAAIVNEDQSQINAFI